jgi:Mg2+ and Co2+ transporter CorA
METQNGAIDYRLGNIEKTLAELKDVIIENKMQARDIRELQDEVKEFLQAINTHDKRIKDLEQAPKERSAHKWEYLIDVVMKLLIGAAATVITIAVTYTLSKMGIR